MAAVGRVARAHGNRGQVIINPDTDFPAERFRPGAELFVQRHGAVEPLRVASVRFQRERPIVAIAGIDTMDAAESLAGLELRIPIERLMPLPARTFYRHALVGCRVETRTGELVGIVRDVEGTSAASRLVVDRRGAEVLIPLASEICVEVDPAAARIVVDPPEGLLEVNAPGAAPGGGN